MYQLMAFLLVCLFVILSANTLSLPAARLSHHDASATKTATSDLNSHPHDHLLPSIPHNKVASVPKGATIHTATMPGVPGTPTWRVHYIKIATMLPVQLVATAMETFYSSSLKELQQTSDSALSHLLASTKGAFRIGRGGFRLKFMTASGRLIREFVEGVLEELLGSTRLGWVTQFRSEWMDRVGGFSVWVTCTLGEDFGSTGLIPGPID